MKSITTVCLIAQGHGSSAKDVFGNILKLDPDNVIAKQQLGAN